MMTIDWKELTKMLAGYVNSSRNRGRIENMSRILKGKGWPTAALTLVVALCAATVQAQPNITCNNAGFGGTPITTYDFTGGATVASFVPTGATGANNGRGVLVLGNKVYYTELTGLGFGPTDFIRIAPFNGG